MGGLRIERVAVFRAAELAALAVADEREITALKEHQDERPIFRRGLYRLPTHLQSLPQEPSGMYSKEAEILLLLREIRDELKARPRA